MKKSTSAWQWSAFGAAAVVALGLTIGMTPRSAQACVGDCDGSGSVDVTEIIKMVNIALGSADLSTCAAGDSSGDGAVDVTEIISAVNIALGTTQCMTGTPTCGDGVVQAPEECDDGGTCIGGNNAGTACTKESDCDSAGGVCLGGSNDETGCAGDGDCTGGGKCVHCRPFGGDGCAANCTMETNIIQYNFKPGQLSGTDIVAGTTGAVVHGDILTIPLPIGPTCKGGAKIDKACSTDADCPGSTCSPATQTLTGGKPLADGNIPFVIKASSVQIPRIPVSTLACACVRAVAPKTCGGTLRNADGSLSTDCTPVFTAGDSVCPAEKKCAFVLGDGNSAAGTVGCNGLDNVDQNFEQDSGGSSGVPGPVILTLSGHGGAGSVVLLNASAIGQAVGACSGTNKAVYGDDGQFCTDDDPLASLGAPATTPQSTGTATGIVHNANGQDGVDIGPFAVTGQPFVCTGNTVNVQSGGLTGVFTQLGAATVGDIVVTNEFFAQ